MPWSGSFARCGLLMTSWTVVLLLSTEMKFQRQSATESNLEDVESTSTTSTTIVNTSNTILPPTAFTKAPRGVAVCIAGNLRTFTLPVVFSQIRPFHEQLWGWTVSFFLYGTLEGAGPKNQTHRNLAAIHETNQTALKMALTSLRPQAVELVANAEDVTEENIAQYVLHQECFRNIQFIESVDGVEAFFENRVRFLRGLNQLAHVISSLEMMMRFEKNRGRRFKVVILTRPDLRYDVNRNDHDWFRDVAWVPEWISNGSVALQMDHWVAMPRALAERFYLLGKVLSCSPSDKCCRRIDRSESLWEYLTGAVHGNVGQCSCSNITTAFRRAKVAQIQRTKSTK